jgi:hypothetical protein
MDMYKYFKYFLKILLLIGVICVLYFMSLIIGIVFAPKNELLDFNNISNYILLPFAGIFGLFLIGMGIYNVIYIFKNIWTIFGCDDDIMEY